MPYLKILFFFGYLLCIIPQARSNTDSIGVFHIDGKAFVLYAVEEGETLYSIGAKYGIAVDDILTANHYIQDNRISRGQIIKLPAEQFSARDIPADVNSIVQNDEQTDSQSVPVNDRLIRHTVKKGETLYSLSRHYGVRVTEIVEWNDLQDYSIREGQVLIVGKKPPESTPESSAPDAVTTASTETKEAPGPEIQEAEGLLALQYKERESSSNFREVHQTGVGTWLSNSSPYPSTEGYYALHKSRPIGTIIKVKNLMNNRVVFAKVIGSLPDDGSNKITVKLPQEAADELHILDKRAMVQVSFLELK